MVTTYKGDFKMDMDSYYWEMVQKNIGVYSEQEQECLRNKQAVMYKKIVHGLYCLPLRI